MAFMFLKWKTIVEFIISFQLAFKDRCTLMVTTNRSRVCIDTIKWLDPIQQIHSEYMYILLNFKLSWAAGFWRGLGHPTEVPRFPLAFHR